MSLRLVTGCNTPRADASAPRMAWLDGTRGCGPTIAAALWIVACGPAGEDSATDDDEDGGSATDDDTADVGSDASGVEVDVVDALLLSSEGAIDRTSIIVHVEVSNLGVVPITAMQLRAFTFAGYASASSIVVVPANADEALPLAPGEFTTLRFTHDEQGALFDCAAWSGPRETDARLTFMIADAPIEAPVRAAVRCRIAE